MKFNLLFVVFYTLCLITIITVVVVMQQRKKSPNNMESNRGGRYTKTSVYSENDTVYTAKPTENRTHVKTVTNHLNDSRKLKVYLKADGRLGNIMSALAAVYAIAQYSERTPVFILKEDVNGVNLRELYPNLKKYVYLQVDYPNRAVVNVSRQRVMGKCLPKWTRTKTGQKPPECLPNKDIIVCCTLYGSVPLWLKYKEAFLDIFTFNHNIQSKARVTLHQIYLDVLNKSNNSSQHISDFVFVGVHVRRGDYSTAKHFALPSRLYFQNAMQYFIDQNVGKICIFVVASNGIEWCKKNLIFDNRLTYFVNGSAAEDMATLRLCNHTITSVGSYTRWVALLTRGTVVGTRQYCWGRTVTERTAEMDNSTFAQIEDKKERSCKPATFWWPKNYVNVLDK